MMSVTVAMSIDYSLFLLTRFREEIEKQTKRRKLNDIDTTFAIRQMTRWSGKVVAFSGFILSITYIGLVAYPMTMLQTVGLGASIAVLCTILINLTCTPALLLMFPNFFKVLGCRFPRPCERALGRLGIRFPSDYALPLDEAYGYVVENDQNGMIDSEQSLAMGSRTMSSEQPLIVSSFHSLNLTKSSEDGEGKKCNCFPAKQIYPFRLTHQEKKNWCNRCWYECGSYSTICPYSLIIVLVVYALISPIGWRVIELRKQLDDTLVFPRNSDYLQTYKEIKQSFSAGMLAPWYVIIPDPLYNEPGDANESVHSWRYAHDTGVIMSRLYHELAISNYNMSSSVGISVYKNKTFTDKDSYDYITRSSAYKSFSANYISPDNSSFND
ncbi:hypothetical protein RFI_15705 [Reticulomyxa filosa]|uniref:Membrane transport protein MMPL domain-containing protein n=1 Tax=Reticulomyxa filosa TaxID=46433 RepID=X6N6X9_RETFI|nr:hypothetical protein RFI_15705 [Reticulomyxa filosa]|eukprot:ETO21499.1 hypothetical protein RFI_15705 [Reticulomyxa filosa]